MLTSRPALRLRESRATVDRRGPRHRIILITIRRLHGATVSSGSSRAYSLACGRRPLWAQAGTIRGTVSDSAGDALANAAVTVEGTGLRAASGAAGTYEIRGVPAGHLHGAGRG